MGPIFVCSHFPHFPYKVINFPTGPCIKKKVSRYPVGKWGEIEVSRGIQKIGYFLALLYKHTLSPSTTTICCAEERLSNTRRTPLSFPRLMLGRSRAGTCAECVHAPPQNTPTYIEPSGHESPADSLCPNSLNNAS